MAMEIDDQLILRLEHLNRLELSADERARMKTDLNRILAMAAKLQELDLAEVAPLVYLSEEVNVLREDVALPGLATEEALRDAKTMDALRLTSAMQVAEKDTEISLVKHKLKQLQEEMDCANTPQVLLAQLNAFTTTSASLRVTSRFQLSESSRAFAHLPHDHFLSISLFRFMLPAMTCATN